MWKALLIAALPAASLFAVLVGEMGTMRNISSGIGFPGKSECTVESLPCRVGQCGDEIYNEWKGEVRIGKFTFKGASDLSVKKSLICYVRQLEKMIPSLPEIRAELVRVKGGYEVKCSSKALGYEFRVGDVCRGSRHIAAAFAFALCHAISEFIYQDGSGSFRDIAAHFMNACLSYDYYLRMQKRPIEDDENWYSTLESLSRAGCDVFRMSASQIRLRAAEMGLFASRTDK